MIICMKGIACVLWSLYIPFYSILSQKLDNAAAGNQKNVKCVTMNNEEKKNRLYHFLPHSYGIKAVIGTSNDYYMACASEYLLCAECA